MRLEIWTETDQAAIFYVTLSAALGIRSGGGARCAPHWRAVHSRAPRFNVGRARAADGGQLRPYVPTHANQHSFARARDGKIPTQLKQV